jgi:Ni/Co efflux regulator RcnB
VVVRGSGNHGGGWNRPAPVRPGGSVRPTPVRPTPIRPTPIRPGGWNGPAPVKPGGQWGHNNPGRPGWNRPGGGKPGWNNHAGVNRPRWGGRVQGRWWAGYRAPGGWGAYQRPVRGWALPTYWATPNWYINDWSGYGLPQPPVGYNWSRYYDDAVLIDGRGSVYDTIGGVDWDQYDPDGVDYSYDDAGAGYDGHAYGDGAPGAPYAYPPRDNGVGGAAVGAVVGGVAGAAIAGRGNRLGGALIGGGVGALTGYAVDKAEDRGRVPPARGYGAGYPPPPAHGYPPAVATRAAPPPIVTTGTGTTVVTTGAGYDAGGYYANGYYYPGASVTTVTVQNQPVVTTTTTEIWEDEVTYSRAPAKKVWRKKSYRAGPKCICK